MPSSKVSDVELEEALKWATSLSRKRMIHVTNMDAEELFSVANSAIGEAVNSFDPKKGSFVQWAKWLITRRITDHARKNSGVARSMHRVFRDMRKLEGCEAQLRYDSKYSEYPISISIDADGDDVIPLKEKLSDEVLGRSRFDAAIDAGITLDKLTRTLKPRYILILSLYYINGLSMKEVGELIGCHESRVSQIISRSIRKMRKVLCA